MVGLVLNALDSVSSGLFSSPDRGLCVLRSWARKLTFTVPPSTLVYKWVPANGNIPRRFLLHATEISAGLFGHLSRMHASPHLYWQNSGFALMKTFFSLVRDVLN